MSTYPGEDPQQPEDRHDDVEQTQPVGYWERQAAEREREQRRQDDGGGQDGSGGAVFNPSSVAPSPGSQDPSGWPESQPGQGWGQPGQDAPPATTAYQAPPPPPVQGQPYAQAPYGQQPYGQVPYGQPAYGPPMGYPQPGYAPYAYAPRRDHPRATTALVLGLVGLVGAFICAFPLLVSPFAWGVGRSALKEIRASQGQLGGEGSARAGMIMGIIGTVLLVLGLIAIVGFVVLIATGAGTSTGFETGNV